MEQRAGQDDHVPGIRVADVLVEESDGVGLVESGVRALFAVLGAGERDGVVVDAGVGVILVEVVGQDRGAAAEVEQFMHGPPARFRCRAAQSTRAIVTSELFSIG